MSAMRINANDYFTHCGFIFARYGSRMEFKDALENYTALEIIAALNCPRTTAYEWKDGRRSPPEWQQPHWLKLLAAWKKKHG